MLNAPPSFDEILLRQCERVTEVERRLGIKTPYVFIRFSDGKPHCYFAKFEQRDKASSYFYRYWHKAFKSTKITDRRPHDLRRAAAVRRDAAGMSPDDNMRIGGWETPEMLKRYLDQRTLNDLRRGTQLLDFTRKIRAVTE